MKIRADPKQQRFPILKGNLVVDSFRGTLRVRKWPRKRGPSKSQAVRDQNQWFTDANKLAKHCAASQQREAIRATLNSGLYPRDLLVKQISGGMFDLVLENGRVLTSQRAGVEAMAFNGFALRLVTPFNIPLATETAPDWPLPERDTAGFWDGVNPSFITIPNDVSMMQFNAGFMTNGAPGGHLVTLILDNASRRMARQDAEETGQHATSVGTGPVLVTPGDVWTAKFFLTLGGGDLSAITTFFNGTVLEAT